MKVSFPRNRRNGDTITGTEGLRPTTGAGITEDEVQLHPQGRQARSVTIHTGAIIDVIVVIIVATGMIGVNVIIKGDTIMIGLTGTTIARIAIMIALTEIRTGLIGNQVIMTLGNNFLKIQKP